MRCWNFWGKDCNQATPAGWIFFLTRDSPQVVITMIFTVDILRGLYQHEVWESLEDKEQELESESIS